MNRDDFKFDKAGDMAAHMYNKAIDVAFNYFESQRCENCKHIYQGECKVIDNWDDYNDSPANWSPPLDFSCNKWSKQDE